MMAASACDKLVTYFITLVSKSIDCRELVAEVRVIGSRETLNC